MTIALDASATVAVISTPAGFDQLGNDRYVAPPLLWSEVTSVVHRAVARSLLSVEFGRAALERLLRAPVERRLPETLFFDAWEIADTLGWSKTYDAEYIAVARRERCALVTGDVRQLRAAARFVEVRTLDDLLS
jgi:predicted nucleic acid-binding protein